MTHLQNAWNYLKNLWDMWRDLGIKEYEKEKVKNISQKRHKELLKHLKENETGSYV